MGLFEAIASFVTVASPQCEISLREKRHSGRVFLRYKSLITQVCRPKTSVVQNPPEWFSKSCRFVCCRHSFTNPALLCCHALQIFASRVLTWGRVYDPILKNEQYWRRRCAFQWHSRIPRTLRRGVAPFRSVGSSTIKKVASFTTRLNGFVRLR